MRTFAKVGEFPNPLHSYDIRGETENFTWLGALKPNEHDRFMRDLSRMLLAVPVIATHA